jgi:outer membrane protein assembly factor BamD
MTPMVYFQLAEIYFNAGQYELAYNALDQYLEKDDNLVHYNKAHELKLQIAHKYAKGYHRHIAGVKQLPKWVSSQDKAIEIYDVIQTALPRTDTAAEALYAKGVLQLHMKDNKAALDTLQTFIKKFSEHPLAAHAYIKIGEIYVLNTKSQPNDDTFLAMQKINYSRFKEAMPSDPRLHVSQSQISTIEEILADGMYEIASYYKRTKKYDAALLYFTQVIKLYPKSVVAHKALNTVQFLREKHVALRDKYPVDDLQIVVDIVDEIQDLPKDAQPSQVS